MIEPPIFIRSFICNNLTENIWRMQVFYLSLALLSFNSAFNDSKRLLRINWTC